MKKPSVTTRSFLLALLAIPYLLVVLGVLSSYVVFYHRLSFQAVVASSSKEELKTLVLPTSEYEKLRWTEEGKEFEYRGKMYDVAKVEKKAANYVITCENDSMEDLFVNWLKSVSKSKAKLIPQIQFSQPTEKLEFHAFIKTSEKNGQAPCNFYSSFLAEIVPPPPRVC